MRRVKWSAKNVLLVNFSNLHKIYVRVPLNDTAAAAFPLELHTCIMQHFNLRVQTIVLPVSRQKCKVTIIDRKGSDTISRILRKLSENLIPQKTEECYVT